MPTMDDFPSYSEDGGAARDFFLAEAYDPIIYFEDAGQEFLYEILLSKIGIKEGYAVVCTGGKTKYKKIWKEKRSSKRIFICDKDFDDITGEAQYYSGDEFAYLGRFCFENYLLDKSAIIRLTCEETKERITEIIEKLDFDTYWKTLVQQYEKLSRIYAVARKNRIKIETTKTSIKDLLSLPDVPATPSDEYIETVRRKLIDWCEINDSWITDKTLLSEEEKNAFNIEEPFLEISDKSETTHLCGKHLLRLILTKIDETFGTNIASSDHQKIYSRLISHTDSSQFENIREIIEPTQPQT